MKRKVQQLIKEELEQANKVNEQFHSMHETYGVLVEEIAELADELKAIKENKKHFKYHMMQNNEIEGAIMLHRIYKLAINAAHEAIQVAAMSQKGIDYIKSIQNFELREYLKSRIGE